MVKKMETIEIHIPTNTVYEEDLKDDGLLLPKKFNVGITTACNMKCRMCLRSIYDIEIMNMDTSIWARILNLAMGNHISIGGLGEPLLHPQFESFVYMARAFGISLNTTTNGLLATKHIESLQNFNQICFSMDGNSFYSHNDPVSFLNLVILSKRIGKTKLWANIIRTKENTGAVGNLIKTLTPFVRGFTIGNMAPWSKELEEQSIGEPTPEFCIQPWFAPTINPKGDVYPCCLLGDLSMLKEPAYYRGHEFDAKKYKMGHISDFKEVWNNEKFAEFRRNLKNKRGICEHCPYTLGEAYVPNRMFEEMWIEKRRK